MTLDTDAATIALDSVFLPDLVASPPQLVVSGCPSSLVLPWGWDGAHGHVGVRGCVGTPTPPLEKSVFKGHTGPAFEIRFFFF